MRPQHHEENTNTNRDFDPRPEQKTDPFGSHLTELGTLDAVNAGVGAVMGGAASGIAVGMVAGPIGAAAGAVIGAVAGGFAGVEVGKMIDPTTEDDWLQKEFKNRPYVKPQQTFQDYVPTYQFGSHAEAAYMGRTFEEVEADVENEFELSGRNEMMPWGEAKPAIADAFNRARELRQLRSNRQ